MLSWGGGEKERKRRGENRFVQLARERRMEVGCCVVLGGKKINANYNRFTFKYFSIAFYSMESAF